MRLDVYLSKTENITRNAAQKLITSGCVTVNGVIRDKKFILNGDEIVLVNYPEPIPTDAVAENIPLQIVYEDDDLLVVNKPKGMVVHPAAGNHSGTLVNALLHHCKGKLSQINGVIRPGIVHRLDKDTEGLLLVAKNDHAHVFLAKQLKEQKPDRVYHAIVVGKLKDECGIINNRIGRSLINRKKMAINQNGREAETHYKVLAEYGSFSYIELRLKTGRTHQIRVHMSSIGHPILGDVLYGGCHTNFEKQYTGTLNGQCLYAKSIGFTHPKDKKNMFFDSDLPDWFEAVLSKLKNIY